MSAVPDLEVKKLTGGDVELAASIAASLHGGADPRSECFGLSPAGPPAKGGKPWGVFLRGGLSAALWARPKAAGGTEITGVAIPRGRWGMGLLTAMASAMAGAASPGESITITLPETAPGMAAALTDAGFTGPDADAETGLHPAGEWKLGGKAGGGDGGGAKKNST